MRWNFLHRRAAAVREPRRVALWLWVPLYGAALGCTCWLMSSCTAGGVVRRSDAQPPSEWVAPAGATFVGMDTCAGCHEDKVKAFADTLHGKKANSRTPTAKDGCESCHGPGSVHVDAGGSKDTIARFGKDGNQTADNQSATCLQCHERTWPVWQHGKHAARNVTCTDCHSIHRGSDNHQLKEKFQPDVCAQCHKNVKADLARQSHHPVREGKVLCSDCHNPHGTTSDKNVRAGSPNDLCFKCHTEKRGPFLWEHAPAVENCLTCHMPHGSIHDKLLTAQKPRLCERCHSNSRHPGTVYDASGLFGATALPGQGPNNREITASCLNCHMAIHGSNHPSGKRLMR